MAQEQNCLAVPIFLFLHFLSVKAESMESNWWKEKKQNYSYYTMQKPLMLSYLFKSLHGYVCRASVHLIPAVMFSLVCLLHGFSMRENFKLLCSEVRLGGRKPPAALRRKQHSLQTRASQAWCRHHSPTGWESCGSGWETEGLEFFPAPVCLRLCYGN